MARYLFALISALLAGPALADEGWRLFEFGGDSFVAGRTVSHSSEGTDDLFMAGETVTGLAEITGNAHLAGREVTMQGTIGGDAYVAGEEVTLQGDVAGDVTVAGREVSIMGVGGDLRATGSQVTLNGPISGYAMVAGETVIFNAQVSGDVSMAASDVTWGDDAEIGGQLIVYEREPGALKLPERLAPAERVERREIDDWEGPRAPSLWRVIAKFLMGVVVVAGLAALIAALVPQQLAQMRRQVLAQPFRTLWLGFLAQSAVIGAAVIFALTVIGLLLTPAMIALAFLGGFAGYVVAAYAFGVGLMLAIGWAEPDSIGDRAKAAGIGALAAGIIGLIPFLGWLFFLVLVLAGIGAITVRVIRPVFFAEPPY